MDDSEAILETAFAKSSYTPIPCHSQFKLRIPTPVSIRGEIACITVYSTESVLRLAEWLERSSFQVLPTKNHPILYKWLEFLNEKHWKIKNETEAHFENLEHLGVIANRDAVTGEMSLTFVNGSLFAAIGEFAKTCCSNVDLLQVCVNELAKKTFSGSLVKQTFQSPEKNKNQLLATTPQRENAKTNLYTDSLRNPSRPISIPLPPSEFMRQKDIAYTSHETQKSKEYVESPQSTVAASLKNTPRSLNVYGINNNEKPFVLQKPLFLVDGSTMLASVKSLLGERRDVILFFIKGVPLNTDTMKKLNEQSIASTTKTIVECQTKEILLIELVSTATDYKNHRSVVICTQKQEGPYLSERLGVTLHTQNV